MEACEKQGGRLGGFQSQEGEKSQLVAETRLVRH